jgi:hypothetical protein
MVSACLARFFPMWNQVIVCPQIEALTCETRLRSASASAATNIGVVRPTSHTTLVRHQCRVTRPPSLLAAYERRE